MEDLIFQSRHQNALDDIWNSKLHYLYLNSAVYHDQTFQYLRWIASRVASLSESENVALDTAIGVRRLLSTLTAKPAWTLTRMPKL